MNVHADGKSMSCSGNYEEIHRHAQRYCERLQKPGQEMEHP